MDRSHPPVLRRPRAVGGFVVLVALLAATAGVRVSRGPVTPGATPPARSGAPAPAAFGAAAAAVDTTASAPAPLLPADDPALPARGFFMGLVPTAADGQDLAQACRQAAAFADFVPVAGDGVTPFYDLPALYRARYESDVVDGLVRAHGMFPVLSVGFFANDAQGRPVLLAPSDMPGATLSSPAWRALFEGSVLQLVAITRPRYLAIGTDVNAWYAAHGARPGDPNGFQHFVSLYEAVYRAVKRRSPQTLVYPVFAYENVDAGTPLDLAILDRFDPATLDLLAITTQPAALRGVSQPSDLPDDYYARAIAHVGAAKPLAIVEASWPAVGAAPGGEAAQAAFVRDLAGRLTRARGVDLRLLGWSWSHDPASGDANGTGLAAYDGTPRPALTAWRALYAGP